MSGPGMMYPGFQGSLPNFGGNVMGVNPGNTVMGVNPPGGPAAGTVMGLMPPGGSGMPFANPNPGNTVMGVNPWHSGPATGGGMGGDTGGNVLNWNHVQNNGGQQMSPLAHAIMMFRQNWTGTPGQMGSFAGMGAQQPANPLMSANPMNRFNIPS